MRVERVFYSVGQGGFFSESFRIESSKNTVVVFDCGSDNASDLAREVTNFGHIVIDVLVISHFHDDHINGIPLLLKKGVTIKNVVVPKLTNLEKVIAALSVTYPMAVFNPSGFCGGARAIEISANEGPNDPLDINDNLPSIINQNTPLNVSKSQEWILKFYVDRTLFQKLSTDDATFLDGFSEKDMQKPTQIRKAESIYKKLPGNFNNTSLVMYSGPKTWKPHIYWHHDNHVGVLLCGDADLSSIKRVEPLVNHFCEQKHLIRDFCIPHHGSYRNMKFPIRDFSYTRAFIQSGFLSQHGHPSASVVNMHDAVKIRVYVVTEKSQGVISRFSFLA